MKARPILDRILDRTHEDENECWVFTGPISSSGYGVVGKGGRHSGLTRTHRFMYEHHRAEIPAGLVLDHLCRNKRCCNPWHLEPVDMRTNYLRGVRKTHITTCKREHPIDGARKTKDGRTVRFCTTCARAASRASYLRKKAAA